MSYILLLFIISSSPLNSYITDDIITLPPSVSFTGESYDYKALWVHDAPFVLVGQYYENQIIAGFVMYTPYSIKPGQDIYVQNTTKFIHVGVVLYRKRMVHVLAPIHQNDMHNAENIKQIIIPKMKEYYGGY